jgi:hypothetical protein
VLTDSGFSARTVSAVDEPIADAEVWCEDVQDGEILGQDTTDSMGQFAIEGLPAERALLLRFRYMAQGDAAMIEGETDLTLAARERRQLQLRVQQQDIDGDGECDAVAAEMEQLRLRLQEMIKEEEGQLEPPEQVMERLRQQGSVERTLPPVPLEDEEDYDKDASELTGDYTVHGLDYLDMHNGVELDKGLYLGGEGCRLSWALYRIGGLTGLDIESLTADCAPAEGDEYFIAVSNFSHRRWEWSGAISENECTFEVNPRFRHVSLRGNLYFLIVAFGTDACTMFGAMATPRDLPVEPPLAPLQLHASKGVSEDEGVHLAWRSGNPDWEAGVESYTVLRALALGCNCDSDREPPEFEELGTTEETTYFDDTAEEGTVYLYAVVAMSGDERSGRSNIDRGFWVSEPEGDLYRIVGSVTTSDGAGLGGVSIALEYGDFVRRVITHRDGSFVAGGLPAGSYTLTPYRRGLTFEPATANVELPPSSDEEIVFTGYRAGNGNG